MEEQRLLKEVHDYQRRLRNTETSLANGQDDDNENDHDMNNNEDDRTELLKALEVFNKQLETIGNKRASLRIEKEEVLDSVNKIDMYKQQLNEVQKEAESLKCEVN